MTEQQKFIEKVVYIYFYLEGRHIDGLNHHDTISIIPTIHEPCGKDLMDKMGDDVYGDFKRSELTTDQYIKCFVEQCEEQVGVKCNRVWALIDLIRPAYIIRAGRKIH